METELGRGAEALLAGKGGVWARVLAGGALRPGDAVWVVDDRGVRDDAPPASPLAGLLLPWFRARKRDLPWRRTQDPYAVWVSEVMLQQTQVATVIPYYEKFLARFPTVFALAAVTVSLNLAHTLLRPSPDGSFTVAVFVLSVVENETATLGEAHATHFSATGPNGLEPSSFVPRQARKAPVFPSGRDTVAVTEVPLVHTSEGFTFALETPESPSPSTLHTPSTASPPQAAVAAATSAAARPLPFRPKTVIRCAPSRAMHGFQATQYGGNTQ
jgi:hypothetical protein